MVDTLQIIRDTVYVTNNDLLDVASKIDGFYNSGWTVYSTIIGLIVVIFGFVIPYIQTASVRKQIKEMKPIIEKYKRDRVESMIGIGVSLFDLYESEGKTEAKVKEKIKYYLENEYEATEQELKIVVREIKRRWEQEKKDRAEKQALFNQEFARQEAKSQERQNAKNEEKNNPENDETSE